MSLAHVTAKRVAPALERQWLLGAARFIVLICVCVVMTVLTRSDEYGLVFLNVNNLLNVVRNASILIIIGVGQTITLTAKDVDLSVGSVLSLTSVVAAIMLNRYGIAFPVAIFAALLIGALLGLINGLLITQVGLPPFIATYGTLWVLFGFAYLILQGAVIYGFPAVDGPSGGGKIATEQQGVATTPDTVDRAVTPEEAARTHADALAGVTVCSIYHASAARISAEPKKPVVHFGYGVRRRAAKFVKSALNAR